jgi:hypothetical protein
MRGFPTFPDLPDEAPFQALQMFGQYVHDVFVYSPAWILTAIPIVCIVPFIVAWILVGLEQRSPGLRILYR